MSLTFLFAVALLSEAPQAPEDVRVDVNRDTWVSAVGRESDANLGGANRLKLKSIQEMTLLDIDPAPLLGRVVRSATLHVRLAGPERLRRVTVGSIAGEFVEGTSTGYEPEPGASSFLHAEIPDVPWADHPGGDLTAVTLGAGGSIWAMADASEPDPDGWQTIPVAPEVVAARVAGLSGGFIVFDDTGSEWTRDGEKFERRLFPNRFLYSRDQNRASAPYFTVELGEADRDPPGAPGPPVVDNDAAILKGGETFVGWSVPKDRGPAGLAGYLIKIDGRPLPRHLVTNPYEKDRGGASRGRTPQDSMRIDGPGPAGPTSSILIRDLGLAPGATVRLEVRAVDAAGNVGPPSSADVQVSDHVPKPLPPPLPATIAEAGTLPKLGAAEIAILDELDKVQPVTGAMVPPHLPEYPARNHLWDAKTGTIRLRAARNEFVAFQILIRGDSGDVRPTLEFDPALGFDIDFGRYYEVPTADGPLPDPIVSLEVPEAVIKGRQSRSLHAEVYVPDQAPAGTHRGRLALKSGNKTLSIAVELTVLDFTLPDALSFLPEMNCYGLPADERAYYRLAHRHRTVLNRLPYHHDGSVANGCVPAIHPDGSFDWRAWDARFGPLLDGSAFADLPRSGVPVDCFYLPLFENWPVPIGPHYDGGYWASESLDDAYRAGFVAASRRIAEHVTERNWDQTLFQFYLNGKVNFKEAGWSRGTSPWLLDEPANTQDYLALRWFAKAFREGVSRVGGNARLVFRADVSRPEWQRDILDGLLEYNVVGGALREYPRLVADRKQVDHQIVIEYGSANPIEASNTQPVAWALSSWALGSDGVLPWQTIGTAESWKAADPLALFYPGVASIEGPVPSVRLKAFRRAQQDVEYLTLYFQVADEPRWAVGSRILEVLGGEGKRSGTGSGGEDAGRIDFDAIGPDDLAALRDRIGAAVSAARPTPKHRLVTLGTLGHPPVAPAPKLVVPGGR